MIDDADFQKETGMTVDESWAKVREWHFAGKNEEAKNGCSLILRFFPEHEAKELYEKLKGEKEGPLDKATDAVMGMFHKSPETSTKEEGKGEKKDLHEDKNASKREEEKKKSSGAFSTGRPREIDPSLSEESMIDDADFQKETGMTVDESWAKVREWHFAGKNEEAKNGCSLILRFFPEHEAKELYKKLKGEKAGPLDKATDAVIGMFHKAPEASKDAKKGEEANLHEEKDSPKKEEEKKKSSGVFSTRRPREIDPSLPEESTIDDNDRIFAAIAYFWFLFLIPLLTKKDSKFVQYHAKQGLVITVIVTIGALLLPFPSLTNILQPFYVILMAVLAWIAWDCKYIEIPLISNLARKINF